ASARAVQTLRQSALRPDGGCDGPQRRIETAAQQKPRPTNGRPPDRPRASARKSLHLVSQRLTHLPSMVALLPPSKWLLLSRRLQRAWTSLGISGAAENRRPATV